jgi:hypothetical protein
MYGGNKQRSAIQFCIKPGLPATETLVLREKVYGNEAVNRWNVFRFYSRFRDSRELVERDERCGRPKSTRTEVDIVAVGDLVKNYRRLASRMIAEYLKIPKTVVLRLLKEDLGMRMLCARFVPQSLTVEQWEHWVTSCQVFIAMADADKIPLTKYSKTCLKRNAIVPVFFSVFTGFRFTKGCVLIKQSTKYMIA